MDVSDNVADFGNLQREAGLGPMRRHDEGLQSFRRIVRAACNVAQTRCRGALAGALDLMTTRTDLFRQHPAPFRIAKRLGSGKRTDRECGSCGAEDGQEPMAGRLLVHARCR